MVNTFNNDMVPVEVLTKNWQPYLLYYIYIPLTGTMAQNAIKHIEDIEQKMYNPMTPQ